MIPPANQLESQSDDWVRQGLQQPLLLIAPALLYLTEPGIKLCCYRSYPVNPTKEFGCEVPCEQLSTVPRAKQHEETKTWI